MKSIISLDCLFIKYMFLNFKNNKKEWMHELLSTFLQIYVISSLIF